jgi:hypothetical protein
MVVGRRPLSAPGEQRQASMTTMDDGAQHAPPIHWTTLRLPDFGGRCAARTVRSSAAMAITVSLT